MDDNQNQNPIGGGQPSGMPTGDQPTQDAPVTTPEPTVTPEPTMPPAGTGTPAPTAETPTPKVPGAPTNEGEEGTGTPPTTA